MSITDELRKVAAKTECANGRCEKLYRGDLEHIADRIDAEHERLMRERKGCIHYDQERHYCNVHDLTTDEHYQLLPKDADGEYIHVGDVLTDDAEFKSEGKVARLMLEGEGWMVGFGCGGWTEPSIHKWHHYHAPTVEDVLREFALKVTGEECMTMRTGVVEEYAAKLQLKEDA